MNRPDDLRCTVDLDLVSGSRTSDIEEHEVRAVISRARAIPTSRGDRALNAALHTVEQALEDWLDQSFEAIRCQEASRIADENLGRATARLRAVLAFVATFEDQPVLVEPSREQAVTPGPTSEGLVPRWRRWLARRSRPQPAAARYPAPAGRLAEVTPGTWAPWSGPDRAEDIASTGPNRAVEADLAARMLGTFTVHVAGRAVEAWRGAKAKSVLLYLLAHRDRPVSKEALQEVLWPDLDPELARRNLHQAVYTLRRNLRRFESSTDFVLFEHDCYLLNKEMEIWCDVDEFEALVAVGRQHEEAGQTVRAAAEYEEAVDLYLGDYLEDSPYDEWTIVTRNRLRMVFVETAHRLADLLVARGATDSAISISQRLLGLDSADEVAHRRIMSCQHARGQRGLALRQYRTCVEAVREQYELSPAPETTALFQVILS